jgi:hypothetical protein
MGVDCKFLNFGVNIAKSHETSWVKSEFFPREGEEGWRLEMSREKKKKT